MSDDDILTIFRPHRRAEIAELLAMLVPDDIAITRSGWSTRGVETAKALAETLVAHGSRHMCGGDDGEGMMRFSHDVHEENSVGTLLVSGLPRSASALVGRGSAHLVLRWAALAPPVESRDPDAARVGAIAALIREGEERAGRGMPDSVRIARPGPERPWLVSLRRGASFGPSDIDDEGVRLLLDGLRPTVSFAMLNDASHVQAGRHVDVVESAIDPLVHIRALAHAAELLGGIA